MRAADHTQQMLDGWLVIQVCRHAYVYWVRNGDFYSMESALRAGFEIIVRSLPELPRPKGPVSP